MNDKLAEAVSGLEEGELVVEAPESNLTEGAAVEPVENRERK
jgi:hypothetical protein